MLLHCSVQDTGIGMNRSSSSGCSSPSSRRTAPPPASTAAPASASPSPATGRADGWRGGVQSEPGQGSTFWFTARLGRGQARSCYLPSLDLRGRRMLVADDSASARTIMAALLRGMSTMVDTAESASRHYR